MTALISQPQLLSLLQQIFGTSVELVSSKVGNRQKDYLVLLLQLRHPSTEIVIKLAGPGAHMAGSFERTAMLNRLVATQTSLPMPEVLAVNTSYDSWPWRYLIYSSTPGQEWAVVQKQMDKQELPNAYRQIGNAVAQLHTLQFPAFGEIADDGSVPSGNSYMDAFTLRARRTIQSNRLVDLFTLVLDKNRHLFLNVNQSSLCHEDLHKYNILFQHQNGRWRLATVLDFDKAWAGHHEIDLARLELWKGMVSADFWLAYKALQPVDKLNEQRRPIYQLLWCFEYAQNTHAHLKDTNALCAQLGIPLLEQFE
jgi:fructosamine-3-kinase